MAKGLEKHQARKDALSLLGKDLARRAGSKCELCEAAGVRLDPWEPPPVPDEPSLDRVLLLCERCTRLADGGKLGDPSELRFLETTVWSELTPLQVTSVRLLQRLAAENVAWAAETLDGAYLSDETQEWLST